MCDFSGSMGHDGVDTEMKSVIFLLETMNLAGIKSEVLGYTTEGACEGLGYTTEGACEGLGGAGSTAGYGRVEKLLTYVFKSFDEPFNANVKARIGVTGKLFRNQNCDGDSVLVAAQRLAKRREKRKILFVLTDGAVCNMGDNKAGRRYLKKLIPEIERSGIEVIGIGYGEGEVKNYYKRSFFVPSAKNLAPLLSKELEKIMKVSAR